MLALPCLEHLPSRSATARQPLWLRRYVWYVERLPTLRVQAEAALPHRPVQQEARLQWLRPSTSERRKAFLPLHEHRHRDRPECSASGARRIGSDQASVAITAGRLLAEGSSAIGSGGVLAGSRLELTAGSDKRQLYGEEREPLRCWRVWLQRVGCRLFGGAWLCGCCAHCMGVQGRLCEYQQLRSVIVGLANRLHRTLQMVACLGR